MASTREGSAPAAARSRLRDDYEVEIKFDPDPEEFARQVEKSVKGAANDAIERFGRGLQEACDEVFAAREGKSAEEIFDALRSNVDARTLPVTLADDKLRVYAKAIAAGKQMKVNLPPPL